MKKRVPSIAMWLLERFGVKRQNDALIGDLVEEYQAGRSAAWFWRQSAVAIARAVTRDVGDHKVLALRAVALGWIVQWTWLRLFSRYLFHGRPFAPQPPLVSLLIDMLIFSQFVLIGWLIARTHRAQAAGMVLAYMASQIPLYIWNMGQLYFYSRIYISAPAYISVPVRIGAGGAVSVSIIAFCLVNLESMLVGFLFTIAGSLLVPPKTSPPSSASLDDGVRSAC